MAVIKRIIAFAAVSVAGLLTLPCLCGAQETEPLVTDRPDFTESAETVPEGRSQLEGGYTFARTGDDKGQTVGELLLRIATGPKTELRIGIPSYTFLRAPGGNAAGFEDASLGIKIKLAEGAGRFGFGQPAVALILAASLPMGASAYRENSLQPEAKLCLGWDLSPKLGFASNLNYGYPRERGNGYGQFSGSASFAYAMTDRTGAYLEYFDFYPGSKGGPNLHYVNGGLTYLINNDLQLDARAGVGMNGIDNDHFIGAGAVRRF